MLFCVFDTPIGACALAWNEIGITAVSLPQASRAALRQHMKARCAGVREHAPPAHIRRVISNIVSLLSGKKADLQDVPLDLSTIPDFHRRVYQAVSNIPPGQTLSYGAVGKVLGKPHAARAVGQAMARNPFPIIVPCHRVLAAQGKLGGFTSYGGTDIKQRLLAIESSQESSSAASNNVNKTPVNAKTNTAVFSVRKALRHLRTGDAKLATLIDAIGPYRLQVNATQNVFLALAEAIVYQQLHGKAAATIFGRVCALFASGAAFQAQDIVSCDDARLRGAGLSQNKLLALRDLASKTLAGEVPDIAHLATMGNEAIIKQLTAVRGIGRWTVEMLLIFRLGRTDVLPVDDFGVRKGFMLAFNKRAMPTPKALALHGERWAPYRTVASWYLWRAADRAKALPKK